jgi:hypothetical protein
MRRVGGRFGLLRLDVSILVSRLSRGLIGGVSGCNIGVILVVIRDTVVSQGCHGVSRVAV